MNQELACRHRSDEVSPAIYRCTSSKIAGLKLVSERTCSACSYRDHEHSPSRVALPVHLVSCMRLGQVISEQKNISTAVYVCHHPAHPLTTQQQCRTCPDYLFPVIAPETPAAIVADMMELPPATQPNHWWSWPNVQAGVRLAADRAIASIPPDLERYRGRGIVVVGGGRYFASAYVTIRVLRHVGCMLPVQLWHLKGEVTEAMRDILAPYGVTCVDAELLTRDEPFRFLADHWWMGWQLKAYALLHNPFEEVLLLDADSYPTQNPEFLFDWLPYRERGAIFWPDVAAGAGYLPDSCWGVFGTKPGWLPVESGQIVVNKRICWRELHLALWYNAHADFVYRIMWGDKDTFNIAWRRLGTEYSMPCRNADWDMHTILQYGPDGKVLFQHRCQDKFRLAGGRFASTFQRSNTNIYHSGLVHEAECFGFLEELRTILPNGFDGTKAVVPE